MKTWTTKSGLRIMRILCFRSNVFLLTDGVRNVLVDTGCKRERRRLEARLRSFGISHIERLILTHSHYDHADNALRLRSLYGASVIIDRSEAQYLESGRMPIPGGTNALTDLLVRRFAYVLAAKRIEPCPVDVVVDSPLDLGPLGFKACLLPTPGHSPGSLSVLVDDEIAIVGDAIFGVIGWPLLPPYADDVGQTVKSWGRLLETGCRLFLPAHGSARTRRELQRSYARHRGRRDRARA